MGVFMLPHTLHFFFSYAQNNLKRLAHSGDTAAVTTQNSAKNDYTLKMHNKSEESLELSDRHKATI